MDVALVATPMIASTGGERQVLRLAIELQAQGDDVTLYTSMLDAEACFPDLVSQVDVRVIGPSSASRALGYATYRMHPFMPLGESIGKLWFARPGVVAARTGHDVVNFHNAGPHWAAPAVRRAGGASVWMCNEPPFWYFDAAHRARVAMPVEWPFYRWHDQRATAALDEIVVLDHKNVARVHQFYGRDARLVRSGLDAQAFPGLPQRDFRKERGLAGKTILLQVGSPAPYKRHELGIEALPYLPDHVVLLMVGRGLEEAYSRLAHDRGVADRVHFTGGVSDADLVDAYRSSDVFLFHADQTWGLVVMEALATGVPVVVSENAGASEVLEPGRTGETYRHGDLDALVACLRRIVSDPQSARATARAGQDFVSRELSWQRYAEQMRQVFEDACGGRDGRSLR